MPSDSDSFLPRIESVFYAVFDVRQGPKVVFQVPEGLIATPPSLSGSASIPPTPSISDAAPSGALESRNSSNSHISPTTESLQSPHKRSSSLNRVLFNFDDISKYVIPQPALCGRLVICSAQKYRIIGFPVNLHGEYERNYFTYNLCFVFARSADLSCYEPIVRKVSRVLTSCEEESRFLSDPQKSTALHGVLEQLYEELNSYSETSIPIDMFNSIELKIFPFYPNPPPVKDWMVPVSLINLTRRTEPNWDLTTAKVCKFIDGVNHVGKIAHLADCDPDLTRQAVSHLLYYQVIMMIDVFQYSNMYTLRKTIQWLADEAHVREECGAYVTKPGKSIPDWPQLLHLYSRLKPGKTVLAWMEEYDVDKWDIDVRRFTSFGVIKGFLRRIHRYPVLLPNTPLQSAAPLLPANSPSQTDEGSPAPHTLRFPNFARSSMEAPSLLIGAIRGRDSRVAPSALRQSDAVLHPTGSDNGTLYSYMVPSETQPRPRRISAAEKVLEQLRSRDRDLQRSSNGTHTLHNGSVLGHGPRTSWILPIRGDAHQEGPPKKNHTESQAEPAPSSQGRPLPLTQAPPPSPVLPRAPLTSSFTAQTALKSSLPPSRPRISRSPSVPNLSVRGNLNFPTAYPPDLTPLLDGEHHTDELSVLFEVGWPTLEDWLKAIGGGQGSGEYGLVTVVYR